MFKSVILKCCQLFFDSQNTNISQNVITKKNISSQSVYYADSAGSAKFDVNGMEIFSEYAHLNTSCFDSTNRVFQYRLRDINNNSNYFLNSGIYTVDLNTSNTPTKAYGLILVFTSGIDVPNNGSWIVQIFIPNNSTGKIYHRLNFNYADDNWSQWWSHNPD